MNCTQKKEHNQAVCLLLINCEMQANCHRQIPPFPRLCTSKYFALDDYQSLFPHVLLYEMFKRIGEIDSKLSRSCKNKISEKCICGSTQTTTMTWEIKDDIHKRFMSWMVNHWPKSLTI